MAEPRLRIPSMHQAVMVKISSLEEISIQELLSVLNEMPSTYSLDRLKSQIIPKLANISKEDANDIFDTLHVMHLIKLEMDLSINDFIEKIYQAIEEGNKKLLESNSHNGDILKDRLAKLMDGKLLRVATKANSVLLEHEHVLSKTRILTDIRAIFGENVEDNPIGSVIVHMLKIRYMKDQDTRDFFVALDNSDISVLIDLLKRAQSKANTLKVALAKAQIHYIDAE